MKKLLSVILIISMIALSTLSGCSSDETNENINGGDTDQQITQAPTGEITGSAAQNGKAGDEDPDNNMGQTDTDSKAQSVSINVNRSTGEVKIDRKKLDDKKDQQAAGGWTLFVYLCGTDLESDYGMGSADLEEMKSASTGDKVRFIVQTGGTQVWKNDYVNEDKLQRYLIQNGEIKLLKEIKLDDMGDPGTLSDFLKWGLKEYASARNGVILWNHGGGSITGVCFDECFYSDSIDLAELDTVLNESIEVTGKKLDFIGFDACLMGTVETANICATYADYMYGSEEVEPGSGWDYVAIGDYLGSKPDADALALGKVVADSFLKACEKDDDDALTTFSIIDLSKIDNLVTAFNNFAKDVYDAGQDVATRGDIVRAISGVDDFGGNNKTEGYTNMIDLGGLIDACSSYSQNSNAAIKAISEAVAYSVSGYVHEGVSGLATYYPISIQGSEELSFFGKICISPYYLSFIDMLGSVGASGDMYWDYDDDTWFDDEGDWYWGDWDYYEDDYWDYLDDYEETGESPYITFDVEPTFEDGYYYFALDEEGMYNTADVYGMVYVMSDDGTEVIEYGETYDIDEDWEYGIFIDNFDGWWLSLPDGQNLATYIVDYTDEGIIYTSPVLLNDKETNLRLRMDDKSIIIEGAWDGIDDESGAASKDIVKLKKGDKIVPVYYSMSIETEYWDEWYGDEYVFDGDPEIIYDQMYPGEYLYAFCIEDIYGDYYLTDFETFYINDYGEVEYE